MARKSKKLQNIIESFDEECFIEEEIMEELTIDAQFICNFNDNACYIVDDRKIGAVLHSVESIILSVIFAILAKCNTFVEIHLFMVEHYEWLDKHIHFDSGLPSLSTIKRVIGFINPKELEEVCTEMFKTFLIKNKPLFKDGLFEIEDIKTMDGKTANSSDRKSSINGEIKKMNAMSIYSTKNNYCEATEFISDKTNEIPTGPELLKRINIKNSIIVFDAMSTQTKTIEYIIEKEGHYVAPVKGNQTTLEESIKEYFEDKELYEQAKKANYYVVTEKSHGTVEKREYIFVNDVDWIYTRKEWKKLTSIGLAKRTYKDKEGNTITDTRYYISDLNANKIELISKAIRDEWTIENKLHWYLDMVFAEDNNKCFLENSQKNLNIIRKFCLGLLKLYKEQTKLSMNSIRHVISMNFETKIEEIINTLYQ